MSTEFRILWSSWHLMRHQHYRLLGQTFDLRRNIHAQRCLLVCAARTVWTAENFLKAPTDRFLIFDAITLNFKACWFWNSLLSRKCNNTMEINQLSASDCKWRGHGWNITSSSKKFKFGQKCSLNPRTKKRENGETGKKWKTRKQTKNSIFRQ